MGPENRLKLLLSTIFFSLIFSPSFLAAQILSRVDQAHTHLTLISDVPKVNLSESFWVGIHMLMDKGWHVYWKNPGDSGFAPLINWKLPKGLLADQIRWPYPAGINMGPLTSFGYEGEVTFWSKISAPENAQNLEIIQVAADVSWLACEIECIPGKAQLEISLPVSNQSSEKDLNGSLILENTSKLWPIDSNAWSVKAYNYPQTLAIGIFSIIPDHVLINPVFFPDDDKLISHAFVQELEKRGKEYRLILRKSSLLQHKPQRLKGVLVQDQGWDEGRVYRALNVDIPVEYPETKSLMDENSLSLWLVCWFAFVGGIILNFMPCVFPVLSLKLMGLLKSSREHRRIFLSGIFFLLGVMVSFWTLAGILIVLKSAGHYIGWGFQFQSPVFVSGMACFLFIFGLNLLGVFEIIVSFNFLSRGTSSQGYIENFLSGMLVTILATPCSAPFMGAAIGFALAQPPFVAFLIFSFLALGMSSPYILLCVFPQWLNFLPKPGGWMVVLKSLLGFLLLACVIWLVCVLGIQKGVSAVLIVLIGLWLIGLGLWMYGSCQREKNNFFKVLFIFVLLLIGFLIAILGTRTVAPVKDLPTTVSKDQIDWKNFSPKLLEYLRGEQKAVFIDFTAAWCLTCQANDRLVFQNKKVVETFRKLGIIGLKADWTNYDSTITQALVGYSRKSIPLYIFYGHSSRDPVILSELITPQYVIETISKYLQGEDIEKIAFGDNLFDFPSFRKLYNFLKGKKEK